MTVKIIDKRVYRRLNETGYDGLYWSSWHLIFTDKELTFPGDGELYEPETPYDNAVMCKTRKPLPDDYDESKVAKMLNAKLWGKGVGRIEVNREVTDDA